MQSVSLVDQRYDQGLKGALDGCKDENLKFELKLDYPLVNDHVDIHLPHQDAKEQDS